MGKVPSKSTILTHNAALQMVDLEHSPHGERTLYSLRHSYITWELVAQTAPIDALARQCGTSTEIIERHYSHVIPTMCSQQLSSVILPKKETIVKKRETPEKMEKIKARKAKRYIEWEKSYKQRGCI